MTPINNSDTAWLIVTDYNQDNNLPYEDLREDVLNPDVNYWNYEYKPIGAVDTVGGSSVGIGVGVGVAGGVGVGGVGVGVGVGSVGVGAGSVGAGSGGVVGSAI